MRHVLLLLILASPAFAQSPEARWAPLVERMQKFVDGGDLAGAVVVVGNKDGATYTGVTGLANLDAKAPMAKETLFRIASMTKPITAMAIMILVDEGKLSLDDPVEKHLPEFKGQLMIEQVSPNVTPMLPPPHVVKTLVKSPRPITIRDLLTHTSGLPSSYGPGFADVYTKRNRTLAETTIAISQQPLQFPPGSKWSYCNSGIDTLGRIIEVASGQRFEDFIEQRIFDLLGMDDTYFYLRNDDLVKRCAVTYNKQNGKLVPSTGMIVDNQKDGKHPVPAGGLFSTGPDIAKLYACLLRKTVIGDKRILSDKSFDAMTKTQTGDLKTGFVDGMSFGYGFAVVKEPKGVTAALNPGSFGHGGAYATQSWADPKAGVFYILMIQRTGLPNGDASEIRGEFQRLAAEAMKP